MAPTAGTMTIADHGDPVPASGFEGFELREDGEIRDRGIESHEPSADDVGCDGIVAEDQHVRLHRRSGDRAIALHADDAINDRIARPDGGRYVDDGLLETRPMQRVLRPAVDATGHAPEAA